jgi:hypothetical protein
MSDTQELIAKNIEGEQVDPSEGVYFIPYMMDNKKVYLSLRKTTLLYNSSFQELQKLEVVVRNKLKELQDLHSPTDVQKYQIETIEDYLEKLEERKEEKLGDEPNPFRERVSKLTKQFIGFFR